MVKKDEPLFSAHTTNQLAYGDCPQCSAALKMKFVGKSSFLGCTAYPKCDYSQALNKQDLVTLKLIDDSHCPKCEAQLAVKKGRYGMFIGCTNFPNCHFISNNQNAQHKLSEQASNIHASGQKEQENTAVSCPNCKNGHLLKKQNRFGKFFYACDGYPKCKTVFNQEPVAKSCPKCKASIMLVKSRGENVFICAKSHCAHVVSETDNE